MSWTTHVDEPSPEYLLSERAFRLYNKNIETPFFKNAQNGRAHSFIYKFIDNSIYLYDTIDKEFIGGFKLDIYRNTLSLNQKGNLYAEFKKIDSTLLVKKEDLPKKVRLNCNRFVAENALIELIKNYDTSGFYFDTKTIKFMNEDEDCNYYFVITEKSREFNIYANYSVTMTFEEDGSVRLSNLKPY